MYVCKYVCMYVGRYVCMYVCTHACNACMDVCICICICINIYVCIVGYIVWTGKCATWLFIYTNGHNSTFPSPVRRTIFQCLKKCWTHRKKMAKCQWLQKMRNQFFHWNHWRSLRSQKSHHPLVLHKKYLWIQCCAMVKLHAINGLEPSIKSLDPILTNCLIISTVPFTKYGHPSPYRCMPLGLGTSKS